VVEPIVEIWQFIFYYFKIWQNRAIYFTKKPLNVMKSIFFRDWKKCENSPQKERKTMKFGGEETDKESHIRCGRIYSNPLIWGMPQLEALPDTHTLGVGGSALTSFIMPHLLALMNSHAFVVGGSTLRSLFQDCPKFGPCHPLNLTYYT